MTKTWCVERPCLCGYAILCDLKEQCVAVMKDPRKVRRDFIKSKIR